MQSFVKANDFFMKTAAIDIGNTFAKIGFFEEDKLVDFQKGLPLDELDDLVNQQKNCEAIVVSSVTKSQADLEEIFSTYSKKKLFLNPATPLPIEKDYKTPETLGADRVAGAVGANFLFPKQNCLIIDMGTAIKYDYVSGDGVFRGGIISPGMRIRFEALHTFTKRLPLLEAEGIPELIGQSTKECIQSGVVNGIIAELNGIIERYSELGKCNVILCGGDAQFFENQIKSPTFVAPNLVLIGLNRILAYNNIE